MVVAAGARRRQGEAHASAPAVRVSCSAGGVAVPELEPDGLEQLGIRWQAQLGEVERLHGVGDRAARSRANGGVAFACVVLPADEHVRLPIFQLPRDNIGHCIVQAAKIRLRGGTRAEAQRLDAVVVSWRRVTAEGAVGFACTLAALHVVGKVLGLLRVHHCDVFATNKKTRRYLLVMRMPALGSAAGRSGP